MLEGGRTEGRHAHICKCVLGLRTVLGIVQDIDHNREHDVLVRHDVDRSLELAPVPKEAWLVRAETGAHLLEIDVVDQCECAIFFLNI